MKNINQKNKYNKVAWIYDYISGLFERKIIDYGVDKLKINEDDTFLDLACGTGKVLEYASQKTKNLFGCDFSINMINQAKKRCPVAKYTLCDITKKLPYKDNQFDKINFSVTLGMIDESKYNQMFKEIKRVLKPEGFLVVVEYTSKKPNILTRLLEVEHRVFPQFQDCKPVDVKKTLENNDFKVKSSKIKSVTGFKFEICVTKG